MEAQLVLATQAAPALIRRVGEPKSGRVTAAAVDGFLAAHRLRFDRTLLAAMFDEADYRREGSLPPRELVVAIAGRYPKRRHTAAWRALAALILGVPTLKLLDVDREPVSAHELAVHRKVCWGGVSRLAACCGPAHRGSSVHMPACGLA
jgi:hypothetical protein